MKPLLDILFRFGLGAIIAGTGVFLLLLSFCFFEMAYEILFSKTP